MASDGIARPPTLKLTDIHSSLADLAVNQIKIAMTLTALLQIAKEAGNGGHDFEEIQGLAEEVRKTSYDLSLVLLGIEP